MNKIKISASLLTAVFALSSCGSTTTQIAMSESESIATSTSVLPDIQVTEITSDEVDTTTSETTTTPIETTTTTEATTSPVDMDRDTILRNVCWGDTKDIVKFVETDELIDETSDALLYSTELTTLNASLMYKFDTNYGLYQAAYIVKDSYTSDGLMAISYYEKIRDAITTKYGKPIKDEKVKRSELADYAYNDGQALELGYIVFISKWKMGDTTIDLMCATLNYDTSISLFFKDSTYEEPTNTSGL